MSLHITKSSDQTYLIPHVVIAIDHSLSNQDHLVLEIGWINRWISWSTQVTPIIGVYWLISIMLLSWFIFLAALTAVPFVTVYQVLSEFEHKTRGKDV